MVTGVGIELGKAASGHEMSNQESENRSLVAIPTTLQLHYFASTSIEDHFDPFCTMVAGSCPKLAILAKPPLQ